VAYSWLGTSLRIDDGGVRLAVFAAMAAIMLVALAMPYWWDPDRGSSVALLAAAAYIGVRVMHLVLYFLGSAGDAEQRAAVSRLAVSVLIGAALLLTGAYLGAAAQLALVAVAVLIELLGPLLSGGGGWRLALGHFAERHGLIVIIALGESIVAIGVGAAGLAITPGLITMMVLGIALACVLWLSYFDRTAAAVEAALEQREGVDRVTSARDVYSYLHFPLVAGLVLMALAIKSGVRAVDEAGPTTVLAGYAAVALGVGLAAFIGGLLAMRRRSGLRSGPVAVLAVVLALGLIPAALFIPAPAAVASAVAIAAVATRAISGAPTG
jgi:low temperature requirement protein LtrA